MRWLKISYVISSAGRPVLLSATLLGACAGGSKAVDAPSFDASDAPIVIKTDVQEVVIRLPLDVPGPEAPRVPFPDVDAQATPFTECIDIDAGADAGLLPAGAQAARVTMEWVGDGGTYNSNTTLGRITIAPEIVDLVIGIPTVDVVESDPSGDSVPSVSNVRPEQGGFAFDVTWGPQPPEWLCHGSFQPYNPYWTFRATVRLRCGGQERVVESLTTVTLCGEYSPRTWASSGDVCNECAAILCEMAPSPTLPGDADDPLPLGSAMDVVIRPLVRVGGALVLLADHAPRDGLGYAWQATTGTIEPLAADVVVWRPQSPVAPRESIAQVVVTGDELAAVASYRWARPAT
jgi:hypothetical protein